MIEAITFVGLLLILCIVDTRLHSIAAECKRIADHLDGTTAKQLVDSKGRKL